MIPKSVLREVISDQAEEIKLSVEYVQRTVFPELLKYRGTSAFVVKGVRRCGKSTLLMQLIRTRFKDDFQYFNFDDDRLSGLITEDLQPLLETLIEAFGNKKNLFFDEIQNVPGWELFVNRLLRHGYSVFITGSNADLLSKEHGTHMTGRHSDIELYPFSFPEFLKARKANAAKPGFYSTAQKAELSSLFKEYFLIGGMPESVVYSNEKALTQVINDIIQKDIPVRYKVRKAQELKSVLRFAIANASNLITYASVAGNFGIRSPVTIEKYLGYAEDAYLIFEVKRFESKLRKLDKNPKKLYCIDNGILVKNTPAILENKGAILENIVAINLKRLGKEFYYYKNALGSETDFIIPSDREAIQVCYELSSANKEREVKGLIAAMQELRVKEGTILTLDQEDELDVDGFKISVMPAWKWLIKDGLP